MAAQHYERRSRACGWTRIPVHHKVLIVKNLFVVTALLFSMAIASFVQAAKDGQERTASDGEYVGLEKMPNLTPEDQDAAWFHENTLVIRNDEAILDKVPMTIRHGKKEYSASDGGFLTYRARFMTKDGQSVVAMRLFQSDYVIFPVDKHDQYTEIKTYPVKFAPGRIEIGGVRYRAAVTFKKTKLDRLVHLLTTEPLERGDARQ